MSWFKSKVSQEYFDQFEAQVTRVIDTQRREINSLRKELSDALTQLSDFKVRIAHRLNELETFNSRPMVGVPKASSRVTDKPMSTSQDYRYVNDSGPDLSTVMLVSAMCTTTPSHNEDSGWTSSYRDSTFSDSSSSSCDSSSSSCD